MEQLDDSMVFYLSALPEETFTILKDIFSLHATGGLKRDKSNSRSKKTASLKPVDLKASNFKCLRGIEQSVVSRLLTEVRDSEDFKLSDMAA